MRNILPYVAGLLLVSAAPAPARQSMAERGEAELVKEIQGLVPGPPERCIAVARTDSAHIVDGTAIVYRALGGKIYVNRPRGAEMLREDDIPVLYVYGSEYCRLDRVKLIDRASGMQRGFLGLGDFVPYTKPGKAR